MSYCKHCGAYMPDWADKCPACGALKYQQKKTTADTNTSSGQASSTASQGEKSDEYRYSYKKSSGKEDAGKRWSDAGAGNSRKYDDKGSFAYDSSRRNDKGTFRYESRGKRRYDDEDYEHERPRTAGDYESEYRRDAKRNKLLAALCYFGPMFILSWLLKPKSQFVKYHVNQGLVFFLMCVIINIFDFIPFMWVLNLFSIVCFFCGISNALKGKRKPLPAIGEITLIS